MRYQSKQDLLQSIELEHERFLAVARSIPEARYGDQGVWGDGWAILDLFAHLTEWEQMFLGWYREGLGGGRPAMPAPGFNWSQTPALNHAIWSKHHRRPLESVLRDFAASYREVHALAEALSEAQLLEPGHFAWTGRLPLVSYLGPNSCSHYRTAARILKRWLKGVRR
jgi:hypothetical protein